MTDWRNLVLSLVSAISGGPAMPQTAAAEAAGLDAEAQRAIDSFLEAMFSGDPAKFDQVVAPEFQILRSDQESDDKVSYLGALPKHKQRPATSGLKVTSYGRILVTTYSMKSDRTIGGQPVEAVSPCLSVFRKEGDRWLIAAHANFAQNG